MNADERKRLRELEPPDCGDSSCAFTKKRGGMRTNGGCSCAENGDQVARVYFQRLHAAVPALLDELDRMENAVKINEDERRRLENLRRYSHGSVNRAFHDQIVAELNAENAALKARVAVLEEVRKAAVVVAEDEIGEPGGNPFVCYFCGCHSPSSMAPWRHRDGCPMSALRAALDKAGEGK